MRAVVYERYGPPHKVLRLADLPRPKAGPGQVLVRVHAASVNSWDWDKATGKLQGRLDAPFRPRHRVLGADVAGVVEAVGDGVTVLRPGDAVFGDLCSGNWGGFAEYAVAGADELALIPEGLSFEQAAAIPQAGALALGAVRSRPDLAPGMSVLINGAGGGAGTFAVQMAVALGARVTGVDRAEKGEGVLGLGASRFIDYRTTDFAKEGEQYDLIIDMVAYRPLWRYAATLKDGGRLNVVGGRTGTLLAVAALGNRVGRRRGQQMGLLLYEPSVAYNQEVARRCVAGALRPVIDSVWPLADTASAIDRVGRGLAVGKVVVSVAG